MPLIWWVFRRPLLAGRSNSTVQSLPSGSVGSCRSRAEEVVEVVWWLWCWLLATHCVLATGWAAIEHTTTGRPWCYRLRTKSNYRLVVLLAMQHAGPSGHNLSIAHHAADGSQLMRMRGIMCDVRVCASCRHRLAVACSDSPYPSGLLASPPTCNCNCNGWGPCRHRPRPPERPPGERPARATGSSNLIRAGRALVLALASSSCANAAVFSGRFLPGAGTSSYFRPPPPAPPPAW
jgi:hypothetical protein